MKRQLEHAHFGVRSEVFQSFRSFGNISELPFVQKYYPASVRSNVFSSFRAFKVFPSFRSFGSITELPFVRKYYQASVRADVLPSVRSIGSTDERRNNVTTRKRKVPRGG